MITSLRGVVLSAGLDSAVIEVGGVGLLLHTTPATAASLRPGAEVVLATTLIVREESLTLYGFADADERAVFDLVLTVSGVGPRIALAMLAVHTPDGLRGAVSGGDLAALTKVPGIGKKGAERIVLELRDKIGVPTSGAAASATSRATADESTAQVRDALVGLGWSAKQADEAVEAVRPTVIRTEASDGANVSALLRAALRELGR
ncbi:MAG TPA: Holliday junction branch migration protein RuvA [Dermatophilaceae bacterium]|jgi:Holliday junction DNA helicase RuvA